MPLTVFSFASRGGYQETLTFWFCLKREHSVTIYASVPDLLSLCPSSPPPNVLTYLFTFPHEQSTHPAVNCLLPTASSLVFCGDAIGHICFQPLLAIESMGSLKVFAPYLIRLVPSPTLRSQDFGVTELSVKGEIVRHHLKSPVPWMPGNCREKLIFQLFKAISFPSSFVKRTALGNESDGSP